MTKSKSLCTWLEGQVGGKYVWGGKSPKDGGYDCSGLTKAAYKLVAIWIPDGSANQADPRRYLPHQDMRLIPVMTAHEGCLIFKKRWKIGPVFHVAIIVEGGNLIEARGKKWGVIKRFWSPKEWQLAGKIDCLY